MDAYSSQILQHIAKAPLVEEIESVGNNPVVKGRTTIYLGYPADAECTRCKIERIIIRENTAMKGTDVETLITTTTIEIADGGRHFECNWADRANYTYKQKTTND